MSLIVPPRIRQKLEAKHNVTRAEVEQCFMNHDGPYLTDEREAHATDPPTLWFIGETDTGRRLKVVFVPEHGNVYLRTAFTPPPGQARVWFDAVASPSKKNKRCPSQDTRDRSMDERKKIPASDEAWESGELGDDPKFAKVFEGDVQSRIDDAMAMQPISIRLPKSLIESFKLLGQVHGLGYQPLMRRALTRFAEAEMKLVLSDVIAEQRRAGTHLESDDRPPEAATG